MICTACSGDIARQELEQAQGCLRMAPLTWSTHASTMAAWDSFCRCWLHSVCSDHSEALLCTSPWCLPHPGLGNADAEKWMLAKLRVQMAITEGLP